MDCWADSILLPLEGGRLQNRPEGGPGAGGVGRYQRRHIRSLGWSRTISMQRESVWDYPRPPAVEKTDRRIRIMLGGEVIVDTKEAIRVLETSHPPAYYVPPEAVVRASLVPNSHRTFCEYKGIAHYFDIKVGDRVVGAGAWAYPSPTPGYEAITGYLAFYPGRMDECWVDDDPVQPQGSNFYGGWITPDVEGPFKGG